MNSSIWNLCTIYHILSIIMSVHIQKNESQAGIGYPVNTPALYQQYNPNSQSWASISEISQLNSPNKLSRMRLGEGKFKMIPGGDAEISCEFPENMLMISNIIWERADVGAKDLNLLYRRHGITHQYDVNNRPYGSTLHLFDVTPLDRGLYRCLTSALDPSTNQLVTIFQDTEFAPEFNMPYGYY